MFCILQIIFSQYMINTLLLWSKAGDIVATGSVAMDITVTGSGKKTADLGVDYLFI